uniref:Purkinje cell protein 4 n=1 Tax=Maylandia zebra TaxID=106582 RepID=A0A3P9DBH6_9CICH
TDWRGASVSAGLLSSSSGNHPDGEQKNNLPPDFDIDMDAPETAKAAVTIQSQFRKFQKKKQDVKS